MNRHATRLLLLNGAPAYRRLGAIVAGVALGTGMLLILLGAFMKMPDRDLRTAWAQTDGEWVDMLESAPAPAPDQLLIKTRVDAYEDTFIEVVTVATTSDTYVRLPDGSLPPRPGEYYASPSVLEAISEAPADQLAERYGNIGGEIPAEMLKGPSQSIVLVGVPWEQLADRFDTTIQDGFTEQPRWGDSLTYQVVLAMGAIALLVPILLLVSIVSQLGAAERRERLATVRLIGAGRKAVAAMSGAEMFFAGLVGAVLGVGVALGLRPLAAQLLISGTTSYQADLMPSVGWTVGAVIGVGLLAGFAAWWRAYRDDVGALGATREREEKPATAWRVVLLALGLVAVVGSAVIARQLPELAEEVSYLMLAGFAATAVGVVIAGPWLTKITARIVRKSAGSAAAVVAAGRLERHPRATFRSVAGLVIAVFVVSVFAGSASAIVGIAQPRDEEGALRLDTLLGYVDESVATSQVVDRLQAVDGVTEVVLTYGPEDPQQMGVAMRPEDARTIGAVDVPESPGVLIDMFGMLAGNLDSGWFTEPQPLDEVPGGEPQNILVITDGEQASIERARTVLIADTSPSISPVTRTDYANRGALEIEQELAVMAYLGMGIAIGISALSLTVATVAAALDRRRTFGLLRLSGMPTSQLRRTVALEATLPLAITLVVSAGLGFVVAGSLLTALADGMSLGWPDTMYWGAIGASLLLAALGVSASFGTVRRSTEVQSTRFE